MAQVFEIEYEKVIQPKETFLNDFKLNIIDPDINQSENNPKTP